MTAIIGISAFYHDSAASLIIDGEIIAAAQEERFSRIKHDESFPVLAIKYLLDQSSLSLSEIDYVVFYDKPFLKFERLLETYIAFAPKGLRSFMMSMPIWLKEKLFQKSLIINKLHEIDPNFQSEKLYFSEHHLSHAASAFYPSPFEEALVLTLDGVGEWATTTVSIGKGSDLNVIKEIHFPHSIGLLYSAFTYYLGFKVNSGEYKVMGLAPYGRPKYKKLILDNLIDLKSDGSFRLDQSYFNYATGLTMTNSKFDKLFGSASRKPEVEAINQFHMDVAASIQAVTEEIVLRICRDIAQEYKISNLCLAGGVALNCVSNGKILKDNSFKNVWIQPASGDAGGAVGAAMSLWHKELNMPRQLTPEDKMSGAYLGTEYSQSQIEQVLHDCGAVYEVYLEDDIIELTAREISNGQAIGWFQGRMEFGPRALGGRSIIADARDPEMQKNLNLKVKFRESFRPFAPSVLIEDISDWFDLNCSSPYMLLVSSVKKNHFTAQTFEDANLSGFDKLKVKRSVIPATTHVDNSSRIQTVHKETNPKFHKLIMNFKTLTGCPVIINTSFNVRGEPIVESPLDAFKCFMGTGLDILVIGNCFLKKDEQFEHLKENYKDKYELD